ncbi:ABC transporter transmembrane domain-containing protein [Bifidobacterium choerinum]|uniref:ABC transporter transmembrane domain-containing protein n=1 Tax=Bifidobacterium choerinum TaxID=35760 RepID=UPI0004299BAE|nr:ABC transporter transmembrane domain-containing protein [Bifidobacterium choerinum]
MSSRRSSCAPPHRHLQRLLDRIGAVLLENLTGVRVVRAFGKEPFEEARMDRAFAAYAATSIRANRLFANLDGLSYLFITLFIIVVYWLCGGRITAGAFQMATSSPSSNTRSWRCST